MIHQPIEILGWQGGQGGPYQWDNAPQQLLVDNPNAAPEGPPPMPGGYAPQVQGYGNVGAFGQPSEYHSRKQYVRMHKTLSHR